MKTMNPRNIEMCDYDYELPEERIAKYPHANRNESNLLVWRNGKMEKKHFFDLPAEIPAGAMMVFNNTKVIQARLHFRKETGGGVEVFCLEPESPRDYAQNFASTGECMWTCLVGNSKKWKEGPLSLSLNPSPKGKGGEGATRVRFSCERAGETGATQKIRFRWETNDGSKVSFAQILDTIGELPIPPYLNRETEENDKKTYQTVYSKTKGSVAAPTAGLHFTEKELAALEEKGVSLQYLTLHVGAGTFRPVKSKTIEGHDMHTEFISVPREVIANVLAQVKKGGMIVAVGTTSVRTLESLYYIGNKTKANIQARAEDLIVGQWEPYDGTWNLSPEEALESILDYLDSHAMSHLVTATQILIAPGFRYRLVKGMVTNFHTPQSTLLLLVSAFVDGADVEGPRWREIYRFAMDNGFRFLSYGDSSLLIP